MQRREAAQALDPAATEAIEPELAIDEIAAAPSFDAAVALVASRYQFRRHPYLLWMHAPPTGRDKFRRTQGPFRFAVEQFPQALAAVLAHVSRPELARAIAENIADEHGHGNELHSHKATFAQY